MITFIKKNDVMRNVSFLFLVTAAVFALPVFFTGEGTEELVEGAAGVTEAAIERHEDMAKITLGIIGVTGVLSLAGMLFNKRSVIVKPVSFILVVLSLASFGTMAQTAHLGGLIRHSEIRSGAVSNAGNESGGENSSEAKETNDSDD